MSRFSPRRIRNEDILLITLVIVLTLLAIYNYVMDAYGGAIISGIGTILVVLFILLSGRTE